MVPPQDSDTDLAALSSLDDPVRRRLYQFVRAREAPAGRDEAADAVGIGRPLAAYHLDKLVEAGLLTARYQRPPGRGGPGAGRPAKVYSPSDREFAVRVPQREYELAAHLLAAAVEQDLTGGGRAALHEVAQEYGDLLGKRRAARRGRSAGARHAIEDVLAEHGFEPVRDEDGTIRLRNCPFHRLAETHRDVVCAMNLSLVEGLVGGLGAGDLRPALDPRPGRCCVAIGVGEVGEPAQPGPGPVSPAQPESGRSHPDPSATGAGDRS